MHAKYHAVPLHPHLSSVLEVGRIYWNRYYHGCQRTRSRVRVFKSIAIRNAQVSSLATWRHL